MAQKSRSWLNMCPRNFVTMVGLLCGSFEEVLWSHLRNKHTHAYNVGRVRKPLKAVYMYYYCLVLFSLFSFMLLLILLTLLEIIIMTNDNNYYYCYYCSDIRQNGKSAPAYTQSIKRLQEERRPSLSLSWFSLVLDKKTNERVYTHQSAPVLWRMSESDTVRPHWGRQTQRAKNKSGFGCRDRPTHSCPDILRVLGLAVPRRSPQISRAVDNVCGCRVRVQIVWLGKLFAGRADVKQDASVSELQLPSVPGPLLSGHTDRAGHQLGRLLSWLLQRNDWWYCIITKILHGCLCFSK